LDGGLELAAVEEDAMALAAVVDVHVAEQHLRQAARTRGTGSDAFRRDGRRSLRAAQQDAQAIQLRLGQLRRTRDLAAIQPEAAALRAEVDLEALERRPVEDRIALHAAEIGCFGHGQDSTSM